MSKIGAGGGGGVIVGVTTLGGGRRGEVLGALQDAEGAALALLLNVEEGRGRAALVDAVGSSRGKVHGGWRLQ